MSITLSPGQDMAARMIEAWMEDPSSPSFVLGGYAGSGKTTLIAKLLESHGGDKIAFCAPTGKAASVLQSKLGWPVSTIHSLLYTPWVLTEEFVEEIEAGTRDLRARGASPESIENNEAMARAMRKRLDDGDILEFDLKFGEKVPLAVVDEASMVDPDLENDLYTKAEKVLWVGDPGQLPPVNPKLERAGVELDFFARNRPDVVLQEIHRQAADSPIIRLATAIREGNLSSFHDWDGKLVKQPKLTRDDFFELGMILVGKHKTRQAVISQARKLRKLESPFPVKDEPIICRRNYYRNDNRIFTNGMIGRMLTDAVEAEGPGLPLSASIEMLGGIYDEERLDPRYFQAYTRPNAMKDRESAGTAHFDWAYAITTHASQGSEWDSVGVIFDDWHGKTMRRWQYTAATRAKERLVVVTRR